MRPGIALATPSFSGSISCRKNIFGRVAKTISQITDEFRKIFAHVELSQLFGLVHFLMDHGHRINPVLAALYRLQRIVLQVPRLGLQERDNGMEIVLYPMMYFLQEPVFFRQDLFEHLRSCA